MSDIDDILSVAVNNAPGVFSLSENTQALLMYLIGRAETPGFWKEYRGDYIPQDEWDLIDDVVAVAGYEVMNVAKTRLVGEGMIWFDNSIPSGWLVCNGQAVSRATYQELFDLWGVQFGAGNGTTTFNLPNLSGRSPMGQDVTLGLGDQAGAATHTLTTSELPAHNHRERVGNGASAFVLATGGGSNPTVSNGVTTNTVAMNTGDTGSGAAHNNLHPVLGVNFIVWTGVE